MGVGGEEGATGVRDPLSDGGAVVLLHLESAVWAPGLTEWVIRRQPAGPCPHFLSIPFLCSLFAPSLSRSQIRCFPGSCSSVADWTQWLRAAAAASGGTTVSHSTGSAAWSAGGVCPHPPASSPFPVSEAQPCVWHHVFSADDVGSILTMSPLPPMSFLPFTQLPDP